MADQVKVFKSGLVGGSDLQNNNELVLLQTTSSTKAVVKDVVVDTTVTPTKSDGEAATVELYSDTVKLAGYETVTGSEIIDTSSKLYYKLTPTPTVSGSLQYSTGATVKSVVKAQDNIYNINTSPSLVKGTSNYNFKSDVDLIVNNFDNTFTAFTTTGSASETITSMSGTPHWYYPSINGSYAYYFQYDGNSSTNLYYGSATNGIVTGSWNSMSSTSYEYRAIDLSVNKIVSSNGEYLRIVDPETATDTSKLMNWGSASTYGCASACNGYYFRWRSTSYTNILNYTPIDTTTTANKQISLGTAVSGQGSYMSFGSCYNPTEDKYYFIIGTTNANMNLYHVSGSAISAGTSPASATYVGQISSLGTFSFTLGSNAHIFGDNEGHMYLRDSGGTSGKFYKVYMSGNTGTVKETWDVPSGTNQTKVGWFERKPTSYSSTQTATASDLAIDVKCKVSGVEITGV